MTKVFLDVTMSLDGFIAGPNDDVERLHRWLFSGDTSSRRIGKVGESFKTSASSGEVLEEMLRDTGAVIMGSRTFEVGEGPWGHDPPFHVPCFVLTHHPREKIVKGKTTFTFVTDGVESALTQAKAAAGDKNVSLMGANTAQQFIRVGLLDVMQIHLVPVILGEGIRLFDHIGAGRIELETTRLIQSPGVTHIKFRVR